MNLKNGINILLIISLMIVSGCIDKQLDFDSIKTQNWSAEWAVPLINSRLNLRDIVKDSSGIIHEGSDGLVILVFENQGNISFQSSDLGFIPNQQKLLNEEFTVPVILPGETAIIPVDFPTSFETDEPDMRLDSCFMKAGNYQFILRTDLNKENAWVEITIPNMVNSVTHLPLHFSFDVSYSGENTIVRDTTIDMNGYAIVFNETTGPANEITIHTIVHVTGDNLSNNSPYFLELDNVFTGMEYLKCFGYFGQQVITKRDTIYLNMFSVNEQENFTLGPGSVNLRLKIVNSFGIPVWLDVSQFTAYKGGDDPDSVMVNLFGEGVPSSFGIDYPLYNQIGESVETTVNTQNSNISEAIEISAGKMCLTVDGHLNPQGDSTADNFALDTSRIEAVFGVDIGLFGSVNGFKIIDTVDFSLGSLDDIRDMMIVLDAENGYPLSVSLQLDFVDSVYQVVHSLFSPDENILEAAPVGSSPQYRVTAPTQKLTEVILTREEIEMLKEADKILITGLLSSTNGGLVKIYMDYYIDMKIGVKVGINY